jgi:hypothetical protein
MSIRVLPIPPTRLSAIIESGRDHLGNPVQPWPVEGWEPLRCCLRIAEPGDQVSLVAYRPFDDPSPWSEVGPVFVHADITLVPEGEDIEPALSDLLSRPGVEFVHVRSSMAQCFTYEVRSA